MSEPSQPYSPEPSPDRPVALSRASHDPAA